MRRLGLSVITACGFALLSACSSSSGLATGPSSSIDHVVFTNGSGQVNDFFVALSGTVGLSPAAVQVNAVGIQGSNFTPQVVYGATFTWSAAFAAEGTPYSVGSSPNGPHKCGAPSITPAIPIYYQPQNSLVPTPLAANQSANVVYAAAVPKVELVAPGTSYCYNLIATQVGGGTSGSVLVVVSNSP